MKQVIITLSTFILLTIISLYLLIPNGRDVEKASNLSFQVEKLMTSSPFVSNKYVNLVMGYRSRKFLSVVIKNPTPSENEIYDYIFYNRHKIDGHCFDLVFLDSTMKEIKVYRIKD